MLSMLIMFSSVGSRDMERQINTVATGEDSETESDAINGSPVVMLWKIYRSGVPLII